MGQQISGLGCCVARSKEEPLDLSEFDPPPPPAPFQPPPPIADDLWESHLSRASDDELWDLWYRERNRVRRTLLQNEMSRREQQQWRRLAAQDHTDAISSRTGGGLRSHSSLGTWSSRSDLAEPSDLDELSNGTHRRGFSAVDAFQENRLHWWPVVVVYWWPSVIVYW